MGGQRAGTAPSPGTQGGGVSRIWSWSIVARRRQLGIYEALELRDGGSDYLGKGVLKEKAVTITWVKARQIFISRGNPTVELRAGGRGPQRWQLREGGRTQRRIHWVIQSYLAELTIFFCPHTKNQFLILLDNRPWLLDQDTKPCSFMLRFPLSPTLGLGKRGMKLILGVSYNALNKYLPPECFDLSKTPFISSKLATGTGIAPFCLFLWNMFFEKHDHYKILQPIRVLEVVAVSFMWRGEERK
ncbi:hypothetical protein ZEAMMB73_Zm00001d048452 [Zea mays]|uniref:Uncharacterized protein n=1 Tax=Zea mays TaxID=4577 RepID=A0A1D6PKP6_MAIZE|nr:hypothetical protein ZEAMMB73_Zm00001d048452 [Zea mays]